MHELGHYLDTLEFPASMHVQNLMHAYMYDPLPCAWRYYDS